MNKPFRFALESLIQPSKLHPTKTLLLKFHNVGNDTVYNPCPVVKDGELLVLGRVEPREHEISHVHEFTYGDDMWKSLGKAKAENIQDPFVFTIGDKYYFGGVEIIESKPLFISNYRISLRTFEEGKEVAYGPWEAKGIRVVDLGNKIGVFSRPRTEWKGVAESSINFAMIDNIQELTPEFINQLSKDQSKQLAGFFGEGEWGGVNSVYVLEGGWLGIIGHIAKYTESKDIEGNRIKKYSTIAFEFNPETREVTVPQVTLSRGDIPFEVEAKRADLQEVIYPGGLVFLSSGSEKIEKILFFYGVVDAYVGVAELPYPFSKKLDLAHNANLPFILREEKAREYFTFL